MKVERYCNMCRKWTFMPILMWDGDHYEGLCRECAKRTLLEQSVGNIIRLLHPITFDKLTKCANPRVIGFYMGPSGQFPIYDEDVVFNDPLEGME